jgi:cytochrome c-type biogenesis protein CcmH/NrfG
MALPKEDSVTSIRLQRVLPLLAAFTCLLFPSPVRAADPQKERAVSALEEDLKTDPNNAELWLHLGFAYRKLGKIDQAQNAFEKVSSLNPNEKDAFFMLGLIYESKNQKDAAEKAWKSYLAAETDAGKRSIAQKHIHHLSQ